jgi:hypothetical protein
LFVCLFVVSEGEGERKGKTEKKKKKKRSKKKTRVHVFVCLFVVSEGGWEEPLFCVFAERACTCAGKSRYCVHVCWEEPLFCVFAERAFLFFTPRSTALKQFHGTDVLLLDFWSALVRQNCEQREHDFLLQEVLPSTLKSLGGL